MLWSSGQKKCVVAENPIVAGPHIVAGQQKVAVQHVIAGSI